MASGRQIIVSWLLVVLLGTAFVVLAIYTFAFRQYDNNTDKNNSTSEQNIHSGVKTASCGYNVCTPTKSNKINIHLVPVSQFI